MKRNAIKGSESQLPVEISADGEKTEHYNLSLDDGEHFEFELLRVIKIKCKRVTKNVIIVISIVILAILIAYLISKR